MYTLIDPVTGEQSALSEIELTRNLRINCILLRGDEHLGIITHRDLVSFSRWCAGGVPAQLEDESDQRVTHALHLVDRWLEDEKSVTSEELEAAAGDAQFAARAAWFTRTAEADWAARAAADATWAAWAAARAAEAAADTTWAAWATAGVVAAAVGVAVVAAWAANAAVGVAVVAAWAAWYTRAAWAAAWSAAWAAAEVASYEAQAQWLVKHLQPGK